MQPRPDTTPCACGHPPKDHPVGDGWGNPCTLCSCADYDYTPVALAETTGYSYWTHPDGTPMRQRVNCDGRPTGPAAPATDPAAIPRWLIWILAVGFTIIGVARLILGEWLAASTAFLFVLWIATGATWRRTIPRNKP